jgi:hypothetical protein
MFRSRSATDRFPSSVQDLIAVVAVGDGYVLRSDRVAVGVAELPTPDLRLYDESALATLLAAYEQVLRGSGERMSLHTYAVAPDPRPLLKTIAAAHERAHDFNSCQATAEVRAAISLPTNRR